MAEPKIVKHRNLKEHKAIGQAAREITPPDSHSGWTPASDRPDPIFVLTSQNATRDADLVPVRHGRMSVSPFTFYRGAAAVMAADLNNSPTSGLIVQLCGDAHLSNFGLFASPERTLLFDLNDFDETLPGPFEYDVKRMAASFNIAARNNKFSKEDRRKITRASVRAYREAMRDFAKKGILEVWYSRLDENQLRADMNALQSSLKGKVDAKTLDTARRRSEATVAKAHTSDSMQALNKLTEVIDGNYRIVSQPPVVVPARELTGVYNMDADAFVDAIHHQFREYRATLQFDRRQLLEHYRVIDVARKVVGVGSVGTRAFIVLLEGRDERDPLFLQVKEATSSVLEAYLPKSEFAEPGERVVQGQRMMQAASDIFLGWTRGEQEGRHLYWRQLRDMKGSANVETMFPFGMEFYARLCGWTLARAHARSGDVAAMSSYLGKTDEFDRSIADFSERYAEQNLADYEAFRQAIADGRIPASEGV